MVVHPEGSEVRGQGEVKKAGLRLRPWQSLAYFGAAREALFVKLASDLCDLWPDSLAATTRLGKIP